MDQSRFVYKNFNKFRTKRFSLRMLNYTRVSSMMMSSFFVQRTTKPGMI